MHFGKTAVTLAFTASLGFGLLVQMHGPAKAADEKPKAKVEILTVSSKAVTDGKPVPKDYTGDGKDISPDLTWTKPPATSKTIAVTCEDPDAPGGTWFHWILFNLPTTTSGLKENLAKKDVLPGGGVQGKNDFGKIGYNGPFPPKGEEHHYHYKVFALDTTLGLKPGANKKQFYEALSGHVVGRGKLTGTYKH